MAATVLPFPPPESRPERPDRAAGPPGRTTPPAAAHDATTAPHAAPAARPAGVWRKSGRKVRTLRPWLAGGAR